MNNPFKDLEKELPKNRKPKTEQPDDPNFTSGIGGTNMPDHDFKYEAEAVLDSNQSDVNNGFARASKDKTQLIIGGSGGEKPGFYNTYVVLGKDTPSRVGTGYSRHPGSGMIDLVVGRVSSFRDGKGAPPPKSKSLGGQDTKKSFVAANNMFDDAARVYISQRTDIDKNFGLAEGIQKARYNVSGIGIKADEVRVIGRTGVKIVTGGALLDKSNEKTSKGGDIDPAPTIELIAGNFTETRTRLSPMPNQLFFEERTLQPIVTADRLELALKFQLQILSSFMSSYSVFIRQQELFNSAMMRHTHISSPVPQVALPSVDAISTGLATKVVKSFFSKVPTNSFDKDLLRYQMNFLEKNGKFYIGSTSVYATI